MGSSPIKGFQKPPETNAAKPFPWFGCFFSSSELVLDGLIMSLFSHSMVTTIIVLPLSPPHCLVLLDLNDGQQFEGLIHEYETWSEPFELLEPIFRGVRGEGDIETSRVRAARRAKRKVRLS